jgi:hypothetical protein
LTLPLLAAILYALSAQFKDVFFDYFRIFIPFLTLFTVGLMVFSVLCFMKKIKTGFYALVSITLLSYLVFIHQGTLIFPKLKPYRDYSAIVNAELAKGAVVGHYQGDLEPYYVFYINKDIRALKTQKELSAFLDSGKKAYVLSENKNAVLKFAKTNKIKILKDQYGYLLFTR